jgi:pilus assembly protein Flp/PilA
MRGQAWAVDGNGTLRPGATKQGAIVDLVTYWQRLCAPFLRARFGRTERGASLVEYALLVALIAVVCIVAVSLLGGNASKKFSTLGSAIQ